MPDDLTGKPDVVRSHAATWNNMANDLPDWHGDAYRGLMVHNQDAIGGLGAVAAAMAAATEGAGGLVELTREIVRDLIADLVARVIVWAVEAIFVVTIPVIASQIAAAIVKWAGRILVYTTALITSITDLTKLLDDQGGHDPETQGTARQRS